VKIEFLMKFDLFLLMSDVGKVGKIWFDKLKHRDLNETLIQTWSSKNVSK
jgi:hypothetical protein